MYDDREIRLKCLELVMLGRPEQLSPSDAVAAAEKLYGFVVGKPAEGSRK